MLLAKDVCRQGTVSARGESMLPCLQPMPTTGSQTPHPMQALWPTPKRCEPTVLLAEGAGYQRARPCVWSEVREAPPMSIDGLRWPLRALGTRLNARRAYVPAHTLGPRCKQPPPPLIASRAARIVA